MLLSSAGSELTQPAAAPCAPRAVVKVQRRKYATDALIEIETHRRIDRRDPASRYIIRLLDTLFHDGHICQVYERAGGDTARLTRQQPMPVDDVRLLTRHVLQALHLLHAQGLVHTDVKPRNILWCPETREARLIDLGAVEARLTTGEPIATREYAPPEMLVGSPMDRAVDLWSLACTVFQLLTADYLFDPWAVCSEKYEEFDREAYDKAPPSEDDLDEEREQLAPGTVLVGKYRLTEVLGGGKFCTAWEAEVLHENPIAAALPSREEARAIERAARRPKPPKTGPTLYEVALDYEHFVLIQERLGPFPEHLAREGKYRDFFYEPGGALRFQPRLEPKPIRELLISAHQFEPDAAAAVEAFLLPMLRPDPAERATVAEVLRSPWLTEPSEPFRGDGAQGPSASRWASSSSSWMMATLLALSLIA